MTLIPRVLLVAAIFLCGVLLDSATVKPFDLAKVTVLWVGVMAALGLWVIEVVQRRVQPVNFRLAVPAGAFLVASGIATVLSRTPVVSLLGWYGRYSGFVEFALYVAMTFLIVQLYWRRPGRLKELVYGVGAASSIAVAYIVVQWVGLDPIEWRRAAGGEPGFRFIGTLGNGNFAGGFLGATSPWLLFAFWRARRVAWRLLVVAWAALTLWCLLLTSSRGGLVALGAAFVAAALAARARIPRWAVKAGAVGALILVVAAVVVVTRPGPSRPGISLVGGRDLLRSETAEVRLVWWRSALSIFASSPVVGTGPDTFAVVFPQHMSESAAGTADVERADKPHNVFLDHLASMGILGFGSYAVLLGLAVFWGLRAMRRVDREQGELLAVLLALVAGYAGQALFSIDFAPLTMIGWIGLGGVATLADPLVMARRSSGIEANPSPARMTPLRWTVAGAVALATALVVVIGLRPWRADRATNAGQDAGRAGSLESARSHFEDALALHPFEPLYRGLAGDTLLRQAARFEGDERQAVLRDAVAHFKEMDELQPNYHLWKMTLGEALGQLGEAGESSAFFEAEVALEDASALGPFDWRVHQRYGEMLNRWARADGTRERHCLALEEFERSIELRDSDESTWVGLGATYGYLGQFDRAILALDRALVLDPESDSARSIRRQVVELRGSDVSVVRCP